MAKTVQLRAKKAARFLVMTVPGRRFGVGPTFRAAISPTDMTADCGESSNVRRIFLLPLWTRPYPCGILPATARTLPGEACQIAIADSRLMAMPTAKAAV